MTTNDNSIRQLIGATYSEVRPQLMNIFRQAHIPEDDCQDLVQEVFMKIMSVDLLLTDQLKGLAVTIAFQKRTDWLRHQAIKRSCLSHWDMRYTMEGHELEAKQLRQAELHVVDRMSDSDAQVYRLSRFEDKTAEEIAAITHLTQRAVEGRLYRTRKLVRESLRSYKVG